MTRARLKALACVLVPLLVLMIPSSSIPIDGLTIVEHRVIALFVFAMLSWVLEPIPIFATAVVVIVLELLTISDKSPFFIVPKEAMRPDAFGTVLKYKDVMGTFASPIIMLFLGGFFLAAAAKKFQLDNNLARVLLKPFGKKPSFVLLGLMMITAIFSMFMSNTATTALMLALLTPVLAMFEADDPARVGIVLGIPFAANIGGIGTPIGTPPNAVAMKYLTGDDKISFGLWMLFAVPYVIVLLAIAWGMLVAFYKPRAKEVTLSIGGRFLQTRQAWLVYITFIVTILLWLFGDLMGMNSYVVALIPVAVFVATGIITKDDLKGMSWDVLWLVSGGIALGLALEESGLSKAMVDSIPFAKLPAILIVVLSMLLAYTMATFMSHTATSNLLLPLIAAVGAAVPSLEPLGGSKMIILAVTFCCSLSMAMPISTPPNALAYASGMVDTKQMMKVGLLVGVVGLLEIGALMYILKGAGVL